MAPGELLLFDLDRATLARSGRREGREIRFLCPAHEDTDPSARWHSTKRAWLCDACRTGGSWQDLAERLGLVDREERSQGGNKSRYRRDLLVMLQELLGHRPSER